MNIYNEESFTKEAWKSLINTDWKDILSDEFDKPYFEKLNEFLKGEYKEHEVFPKRDDIFTALNHTSFKDTKILLLGQDPVSQRWSGSWACIFSSSRNQDTTITKKYVQGVKCRVWLLYSR